MLMERVVQLVRDGVTGMDLLEVFLRRCIQPLQYRGHPMWLYCGTEDTTRVHPEAVDDAMLERWEAENQVDCHPLTDSGRVMAGKVLLFLI